MLSMPCSAHTYSHTYGVCVSFSTICQIELNVRKDEYVMGFPGKCRLSIVVFGAGAKSENKRLLRGRFSIHSPGVYVFFRCDFSFIHQFMLNKDKRVCVCVCL